MHRLSLPLCFIIGDIFVIEFRGIRLRPFIILGLCIRVLFLPLIPEFPALDVVGRDADLLRDVLVA